MSLHRLGDQFLDLYRYDVEKQEWKLISSPNSPPPRSAHQAVTWKNYLYIFGGEFTFFKSRAIPSLQGLLDVGPENKSMGTT